MFVSLLAVDQNLARFFLPFLDLYKCLDRISCLLLPLFASPILTYPSPSSLEIDRRHESACGCVYQQKNEASFQELRVLYQVPGHLENFR